MSIIKKSTVIFTALVLVISLLSACAEPSASPTSEPTTLPTINPKSPDEMIVILHAGGGAGELTYINAQETFEYYYNLGYRYFEYDLQLSSDGRLIGTHAWEHLSISYPESITYEEFKALRLDNGYTPVNEEWLIETIRSHPDVNIVVDAKMNNDEGDAQVLMRLEALESIYNIDISANIIPEIFSIEMWDLVKDTTSFDRYLFSHYKVYYTVGTMLEYFSNERFWGFAFPTYTDGDIRSQIPLIKQTKKLFIFSPSTHQEVLDAAAMGADGVYIDFVELMDTDSEN